MFVFDINSVPLYITLHYFTLMKNLIFGLFYCAAICCSKRESNKCEQSPKSGSLLSERGSVVVENPFPK